MKHPIIAQCFSKACVVIICSWNWLLARLKLSMDREEVIKMCLQVRTTDSYTHLLLALTIKVWFANTKQYIYFDSELRLHREVLLPHLCDRTTLELKQAYLWLFLKCLQNGKSFSTLKTILWRIILLNVYLSIKLAPPIYFFLWNFSRSPLLPFCRQI